MDQDGKSVAFSYRFVFDCIAEIEMPSFRIGANSQPIIARGVIGLAQTIESFHWSRVGTKERVSPLA